MGDTEEYFPRGGKKPTLTYFKQSSNFLGAPEKSEKKKKRQQKKPENDDGYLSDERDDTSFFNCASGMNYNIIKEGVLLLGRVNQVWETKLSVMLPGKLFGEVMACHISEPYNKLMEAYVNDQMEKFKKLPGMFRRGQYVALSVLEVNYKNHNKLMLSMMPQHINGGKKHTDLHKGTLLQAAVSSVEDHGYAIDLGVPNVRAFLPKKNANPDIELDIGMITWCCVETLSPSSNNSVVTLSNELTALQKAIQRKGSATQLLPATSVEFTVDQCMPNGIEGHVFDNVTAYVQRQHANNINGKKPTLGQKVRARLLFVMPTRKTPFLTMRNIFETTYPDLEKEQKFKQGDIIEDARVIFIGGKSIYFKLGEDGVGTLSHKRVQGDEDLADKEVITKSYLLGSKHKVRVLCYHLTDYTYAVTDEPALLSEQYFSYSGLHVGQLVHATVRTERTERAPRGALDGQLVLNVGRLTGFVPQMHLTDSGVYIDPKKTSTSNLPKKKYKAGQRVKARVLVVEPARDYLVLTMKPSLLAPELETLYSYEQAEVGKAYTGVIRVIRDYLLVSFFNNMMAYVPANRVCKETVDNLTSIFHIGQIVKCTILRVDVENKKMTGSLTTEPFWPAKTPGKRKRNTDNTDEVPSKKLKNDDQQTETKKNNKKKNKENAEDKDTRKSKKKNKNAVEEVKQENASEENDAIDTNENNEQILTANDVRLIDISTCVAEKDIKKRVKSLKKAVKVKRRRLKRVNEKLARIEGKGLNSYNKKFHTAMHREILILGERVKQLMDALAIAQSKYKEFNKPRNEGNTKKIKKIKKEQVKKEETENGDIGTEKKVKTEEEVEKKKAEEKKKENIKQENKIKEIKIVESLEPALEIPSVKDFWSANAENLSKSVLKEEPNSSDDEDKEQPKKKRKKLTAAEKVSRAREEEERVRALERRAAEGEGEVQPRAADHYERALLAHPNSSQLWIAYMAFNLQATEVDKARAVGRRALTTISFREESEKLNVWLAMLNLENRFGTKETQQKTLEEALQMNDKFKVHSKLLDIYVEMSNHQELSALVDLMLKKYKQQPDMYIMCGAACFKLGLVDKARQVMQKAVRVLDKKEHVSVLVQFALLERSSGGEGGEGGEGGGGRERAEALLEHVLAVYPQRVDVCAVYVDMMLKDGQIDQVRQVMDRMTSQKLPARKMKVLYKKWVEIEEKLGNHEQVESIRQKAVEFLDKAKF